MVLFLILVAICLVVAGVVSIARRALLLGVVLIVLGALVFLLRHEIAANTPDDAAPAAVQT